MNSKKYHSLKHITPYWEDVLWSSLENRSVCTLQYSISRICIKHIKCYRLYLNSNLEKSISFTYWEKFSVSYKITFVPSIQEIWLK